MLRSISGELGGQDVESECCKEQLCDDDDEPREKTNSVVRMWIMGARAQVQELSR